MELKIKYKDENAKIIKGTQDSAGIDLVAHSFLKRFTAFNTELHMQESVLQMPIAPRERLLVGTGIYLAIPKGYVVDIRPRSGLALKKGLTVLNSPGTIDADYRGEIGIILINTTDEYLYINIGDKVAQMVMLKHEEFDLKTVDELPDTERGEGGFGSTGK